MSFPSREPLPEAPPTSVASNKAENNTGNEQMARVVALAETGWAWVEMTGGAREHCEHCHDRDNCGIHLTRIFRGVFRGQTRCRVRNLVGANPGDTVVIAFASGESDGLVGQIMLVYIFPLVALLLGAILGDFAADSVGALVGGVSAFILALKFMPEIGKRYLANSEREPKIGKIVACSSDGGTLCNTA